MEDQKQHARKERDQWLSKHEAMKDQLEVLKEECRKLQVRAFSPTNRSAPTKSTCDTAGNAYESSHRFYDHNRLRLGTAPFIHQYMVTDDQGSKFEPSSARPLHVHVSGVNGVARDVSTFVLPHSTSTPLCKTTRQFSHEKDQYTLNPSDTSISSPGNETVSKSSQTTSRSFSKRMSAALFSQCSGSSLHCQAKAKNDGSCTPQSIVSSVISGRVTDRAKYELSKRRLPQLQREVAMLEELLADKDLLAKQHVEELTELRAQLAQERSSLYIIKQEITDKAAEKLTKEKEVHKIRFQEIQGQMERLKKDKMALKKELDKTKSLLLASQSEVSILSKKLWSVNSQLEHEKKSYRKSVQTFQSEIKTGHERVSQLEQALEICKEELNGQVLVITSSTAQHKLTVEQFQGQIRFLSREVEQSREELRQKTAVISSLQTELIVAHNYKSNVKRKLDESQAICNSLSKEIEDLKERHQVKEGELVKLRGESHALIADLKKECIKLKSNLEQVQSQLQETIKQKVETELKLVMLMESEKHMKRHCEDYQNEIVGLQKKATQQKEEADATLYHLQQELTKRSQQVLEIDGLLRNHQADTAARQLKLERHLAQRHSEIKTRTQELEAMAVQLDVARKHEQELQTLVESLEADKAAKISRRM